MLLRSLRRIVLCISPRVLLPRVQRSYITPIIILMTTVPVRGDGARGGEKKEGLLGVKARGRANSKRIYIYIYIYTHIHMHTHIQVYRCALNPKSLLYPTFHSLHPCHPCRLFFRHKSESPVGPAGTERERDLSLVQRMRDKMHWELRISPRCSSK